MDNIEFCNLVKEAKKMSGKSNTDLVIALKKSVGALNDMLRPKGNYAMSRYISFLTAIDFYIVINYNRVRQINIIILIISNLAFDFLAHLTRFL